MRTPAPRLPSVGILLVCLHIPGAVLLLALSGFVVLAMTGTLAQLRTAGLWYALVAYTACIPMNLFWVLRARARMRRWDQTDPTAAEHQARRRRDAVRSLTLYRPAFWLVFSQWCVAALALPLYLELWGIPWGRETWLSMLLALGLGTSCALIAYYLFYLLVTYRISPVILAAGHLLDVENAHLTRAWMHLVRLVMGLGVAQPLTAGAMLLLGTQDVVVVAYMAVMLFFVMAIQVQGVLTSISRPSGHLATQMAAVRKGHLDVQARVDNLDTFGQLSADFNAMVEGLRQREMIRETFGRYVTQQVADDILGGNISLGGEKRVATVLFSDIRGFTQMSEHMRPEDVVAFLNQYLEMMVSCVFAHGGVLDKFIGDAVMAVFGAPATQGSPALDAVAAAACAVEMSQCLDQLNATRIAEGAAPIEIGIGLCTGELIAGNIGSPLRVEYTVIGDTVNLSSRIEGLTKEWQQRILLADTTARLVESHFAVRPLRSVEVRGRAQAVEIYALDPEPGATQTPR